METESKITFTEGLGLPQQVAEHLSGEIRDGKLKPGHKLAPENELCKAYNVSRTVIREAIARLKHEGLVESRQGSGITVVDWKKRKTFLFSIGNLDDPYHINFLYEMRAMAMVESVVLASIRRSEIDLKRLRHLMEEMAEATKKGEDGAISHRAFHKCIVEASYNPYLIELENYLQEKLWQLTKQARKRTQDKPEVALQVQHEHKFMLEAIEFGEPDLAREATISHLRKGAVRNGLQLHHKL
jgi:GntR family transcriptional regulator, transcriptional repressor for pyruvate dehydrogenase complex